MEDDGNIGLLKTELVKVITAYEKSIADYIEENGVPKYLTADEVSAYQFSVDRDGVPYAAGHAEDTYGSGYDNGLTEGEAMLAYRLLDILGE